METGIIQVPGKKGAEITPAKRVNETPDIFSTVLCRSSVNEANELNFCCLATLLIPFLYNRRLTQPPIPLGLACPPLLLSKVGRWEHRVPWSRACPSCLHPRQESGVWWPKGKLQPPRPHLPPQGSASSFCSTCTTAPRRFPLG